MRSLKLAAVVLAAALVPAACAGAGKTASTTDAQQEAATKRLASAEDGEKIATTDPNNPVICHTEADTTTRVRKYKTCRTKAEWDEMERQGQKQVEEQIRGSGYNKTSGN